MCYLHLIVVSSLLFWFNPTASFPYESFEYGNGTLFIVYNNPILSIYPNQSIGALNFENSKEVLVNPIHTWTQFLTTESGMIAVDHLRQIIYFSLGSFVPGSPTYLVSFNINSSAFQISSSQLAYYPTGLVHDRKLDNLFILWTNTESQLLQIDILDPSSGNSHGIVTSIPSQNMVTDTAHDAETSTWFVIEWGDSLQQTLFIVDLETGDTQTIVINLPENYFIFSAEYHPLLNKLLGIVDITYWGAQGNTGNGVYSNPVAFNQRSRKLKQSRIGGYNSTFTEEFVEIDMSSGNVTVISKLAWDDQNIGKNMIVTFGGSTITKDGFYFQLFNNGNSTKNFIGVISNEGQIVALPQFDSSVDPILIAHVHNN